VRSNSRSAARASLHDDASGPEHVEQRAAADPAAASASRPQVDGQDVDPLELAGRALVQDVELADRRELIAPEFEADRIRRTEPEQVDDAAAHGELPDALDQRSPLEAHALQPAPQAPGRRTARPVC
jgi:hypothetical protein